MNITIVALGSRGDVQPYVALGKGLQQAGHCVSVMAHNDFEQLITDYGLSFVDLGGSIKVVAQSLEQLLEQGQTLKIFATQAKIAQQLAQQVAVNGLAACQNADLIVGGLGGLFIGWTLAEKLGLPFLQAHLLPLTPTREFASVLAPPLPQAVASAWANGLSHRVTQQMLWQMFRAADAQARAEVLHMKPAPFWGPFAALGKQNRPVLYGYSPQVLPRPSDWKANLHVTGYWFLEPPAQWQPPAELVQFLQAGPPPVYVGFGSMPNSKPEAAAELVVQALARAGQRGVIASGWGGLRKEQLPASVFMIEALPHSWLFPHMAAVVHHGGAGTTAAGLQAGVPSIITPFFADQPFWGRRVYELGVGPRPIARRALAVDKLAAAMECAVSDQAMRKRAAELGARIRGENGVARAVSLIGQALGGGA